MSKNLKNSTTIVKRLFNDKQITDVLKLPNATDMKWSTKFVFGLTWVDEGYIAGENIAGLGTCWPREIPDQRISGILTGKYQRFAVVNSRTQLKGTGFILTFTSRRYTHISKVTCKGASWFITKNLLAKLS